MDGRADGAGPGGQASAAEPAGGGGGGKTWIADEVVSIIAQIAAEQVEGVHQLGESNLRSMLPKLGRHRGVESEVGLKEAAIDIEVVVTFGYPIWQVADTIREQVIESVEHMTRRRVVEVNIHIVDVHVPKVAARPSRRVQ